MKAKKKKTYVIVFRHFGKVGRSRNNTREHSSRIEAQTALKNEMGPAQYQKAAGYAVRVLTPQLTF